METLEAIRQAAKTITLTYPHDEDGRITSAVKEKEYLTKLKTALGPLYNFEIPPTRAWYDFKVNGIFINLKISQGGCDNAFNKKSLMLTWGGSAAVSKPGNMNKLWEKLNATPRIETRNILTEYHYLVVYKKTGDILLKSLVDIHTYRANCAGNVMQINWTDEWINKNYVATSRSAKMLELAKVVQEACRKQCENMRQFVDANLI